MGSAEMWLLEEQLLPVGCQSPSATWSILLTVCSGPERAISQCSGDRGAASQELMRLWILGTQRTVELCVPVSRLKYLKKVDEFCHIGGHCLLCTIYISVFLWLVWLVVLFVHYCEIDGKYIFSVTSASYKEHVLNLSTPSLCYLLCNILTHGWCNTIE